MNGRSIWKFLVRVALAVFLVVALLPTIASAQSGMGGQSRASQMPLKVVIMLGPNYDFSKPPFIDASDVLSYFKESNGSLRSLLFSPPIFDTIDVDVETAIPSDRHKIVVAVMPPDLNEMEQQKFKRKVQLIALRFGINQVETVSRSSGGEGSENSETIWLRVPIMNTHDMGSEATNYAEIAVALANALDDELTHQARLDIYQVRGNSLPSYDPFFNEESDPFAGCGGDPLSSGGKSDPFGAPASRPSDAPVKTVSPQLIDEVSSQAKLADYTRKVELFKQRAKAAMKSGAPDDNIRKVLLAYAVADYQLHTELQRLKLSELESKLDKIRGEIQKRESESVKHSRIIERARRMLESRDQ